MDSNFLFRESHYKVFHLLPKKTQRELDLGTKMWIS